MVRQAEVKTRDGSPNKQANKSNWEQAENQSLKGRKGLGTQNTDFFAKIQKHQENKTQGIAERLTITKTN